LFAKAIRPFGAITVAVPYKSTRIGIFLAICWLYACIHLDRQILGVLAESVKSDLHLRDQQLGVLTGSAFSIVYALLGLYFGALADRADRLRLIRTGAWVWSISCIAAAFATSYSMLIATRAGVAVGEAIASSAAVSLIAELAGEKYRARAASAFLTSAFIGAGMAAILGGAIVGWFRHANAVAGWRAALVAVGLPGIAGAAYLWLFQRQETGRAAGHGTPGAGGAAILMLAALGAVILQMVSPPIIGVPVCVAGALAIAGWWTRRLRRTDPAAYGATWGQKSFRLLVLGFAAVTFVDYAAAFWFIPYTQRRFGLGAETVGPQLGLLMIVGGIAGCLAGGWLADRWRALHKAGRVWTALIAVLGEGTAILLALSQTDYSAFVLAFGAFCLASGGWTGVAAAIAFDVVPREHRGTGTSIYFLLTTTLGPGLGPFVVGFGSDRLGSVRSALALGCVLVLFAAVALLQLGVLLNQSSNLRAADGQSP
jgi:MFS family permease